MVLVIGSWSDDVALFGESVVEVIRIFECDTNVLPSTVMACNFNSFSPTEEYVTVIPCLELIGTERNPFPSPASNNSFRMVEEFVITNSSGIMNVTIPNLNKFLPGVNANNGLFS